MLCHDGSGSGAARGAARSCLASPVSGILSTSWAMGRGRDSSEYLVGGCAGAVNASAQSVDDA